MSSNRSHSAQIAPPATTEEAAAIVAAMEQFMRSTAAPPSELSEDRDPWLRATRIDAVEREPRPDAHHPWINT